MSELPWVEHPRSTPTIMFDVQFLFCEHKLGSPTPWHLSRDVKITTFNGILDVNFHVHCYILRTCALCMGVFQCAWWEQIIHGGSPMECKYNPFVFIDEIFHITIYFFAWFYNYVWVYWNA